MEPRPGCLTSTTRTTWLAERPWRQVQWQSGARLTEFFLFSCIVITELCLKKKRRGVAFIDNLPHSFIYLCYLNWSQSLVSTMPHVSPPLCRATVYGVEPDLTREGGSIPVTLTFQEATGRNVMLLPVGSSDDGAHSQNEKINRYGINMKTSLKFSQRWLAEM